MQDKQKVTLYLPARVHRQLKIRAEMDEESMSGLVEKAIAFYLKHPEEFVFPIADEINILISKEDLLELIEQIEVNKGKKEPRLASLYASLAKIYNNRLLNLPLSDYRQEQQLAIEYYQKAIDLQKELNLELDLVASLNSLADIYYSREEYQKAIEFYQQSLAIKNVYDLLGKYQKAIEFHQQSLAITREIGDRKGEAKSYIGLGNVYNFLGEYQKAIEFYQKSLEIFQEIGYIIGEPKTWFNLGVTYYSVFK